MKLRVIATLVAILGLGAGSAAAQSIGLFSDNGATSCNYTNAPYNTFYVIAVNTDQTPNPGGGFQGCEFKVELDGATFSQGPFVNTSATTTNGSPTSDPGFTAGWPSCQGQGGMGILAEITGTLSGSTDKTFRIVARNPPNNPNFDCPLLTMCDDPNFTKVCMPGGEMFVDSQRDCTVAVETTSWSEVKSLFNE